MHFNDCVQQYRRGLVSAQCVQTIVRDESRHLFCVIMGFPFCECLCSESVVVPICGFKSTKKTWHECEA